MNLFRYRDPCPESYHPQFQDSSQPLDEGFIDLSTPEDEGIVIDLLEHDDE